MIRYIYKIYKIYKKSINKSTNNNVISYNINSGSNKC